MSHPSDHFPQDPDGYRDQGYPPRLNQPFQGYGGPVGPPRSPTGTSHEVASTGVRIAGFVIDAVVVGILALVVTFPADTFVVATLLGLTVWAAYYVAPTALAGQTLAKRLLGTKVVRIDDSEVPGWSRALGRQGLLWVFNLFCYVPQIINAVLLAQDPHRQGWHDKAVGTVVVTTR
ncbi:RDD family protein [Nocardioides sp. SOB44]|uniref:RDD family protein n=1 Tax=Nocardioides cremeus TaxID=3058044 RepID=A0ABT8TT15_9ACTN|nr:RDD family protein [Nocardioides cremeus]MDO3396971.1 RDD family protein [Nocardioides cremeus]